MYPPEHLNQTKYPNYVTSTLNYQYNKEYKVAKDNPGQGTNYNQCNQYNQSQGGALQHTLGDCSVNHKTFFYLDETPRTYQNSGYRNEKDTFYRRTYEESRWAEN